MISDRHLNSALAKPLAAAQGNIGCLRETPQTRPPAAICGQRQWDLNQRG